jgi:hypothetical protein
LFYFFFLFPKKRKERGEADDKRAPAFFPFSDFAVARVLDFADFADFRARKLLVVFPTSLWRAPPNSGEPPNCVIEATKKSKGIFFYFRPPNKKEKNCGLAIFHNIEKMLFLVYGKNSISRNP